MLRALVLSLGAVVGVRKGGSQNGLQPSHRELMSALIERGKKFDARSLVAVMESITPTVAGNITDIVTEMEQTVLKSIRDAHIETQTRLDGLVHDLEVKVNATSQKKNIANQKHADLQTCVSIEKQNISATVDKQNTYNLKWKATFEPCGREISTKSFTANHGSIQETCDTDVDADCSQALQRLESQISGVKSELETFLDGKVAEHNLAERDCQWATDNASAAMTAIENQQDDWWSKHLECLGTKSARNSDVCTFGEKLQDACDVHSAYQGLVTDAGSADNIHSVSDRKEEALAIQTVLCVLKDFLQNNDITEASTSACHTGVDLAEFNLDLKATEVSNILAVNHNDDLTVTCVDRESHSFKGGYWESPLVDEGSRPDGYVYNTIPSAENVTKDDYVLKNEGWMQAVDLTNANKPFDLPECTTSS